MENVESALASLTRDFEEGDVGAGTGTTCYGLKGGIGSASRELEIEGHTYTIGVLVQSNYGSTRDFLLDGRPMGLEILKKFEDTEKYPSFAEAKVDQGSIIMVVATDLPVNERQLKRIIRRCGVGLARIGSFTGHGSGEIMIGFTTANAIPANRSDGTPADSLLPQTILREGLLDPAFHAVAEATEEAVLNSMVCANTAIALDGRVYYSLREFL